MPLSRPHPRRPRAVTIYTDPRLREIQWADLIRLGRLDIARELTLSLPWLVGSLVFAHYRIFPVALAFSFVFFLTSLRQVHNAYHYALGLRRSTTEWVMFVLSVVMLGSMHAVQITHLRHHRFLLADDDVEAMSARLRWWQAILIGPLFPIRLHRKAVQCANRRQLTWIIGEVLANAVVIGVVWLLLPPSVLRYHTCAMAVGQCLTSFFAVWTVHHDCDRHSVARTVRSRVKSFLTYGMFFHLEHHLFPRVPTSRLSVLASRLDQTVPGLRGRRVF
jgi:fatty acid desaturase